MSSFNRIAFVLFFLSVSTGSASPDRRIPNVPWITREDGESFLQAFIEAMIASDELQQQGIDDLESMFESLLSLIPEIPEKLSIAKLQALNMVFASIIADIVAIEGRGSTEHKTAALREALIWAFRETSGIANSALINEILRLTELFSEEEEDNSLNQEFPQQGFPEFTSQVGSFETLNAATSGNVDQQFTSTSEAAQSSSALSTTTSTTQTYSGSAASSASATSSASSEASSLFTQFLTSSLIQNPEFVSRFNSIESSAAASTYASSSAKAVAYAIGQGSIASNIASAVSQATTGVSLEAGASDFIQTFASSLAQTLSAFDVLNSGNAITLANQFADSLLVALPSAVASSGISAASSWSTAGSQISSLQTSSGDFASASGASGASYGLSLGSPVLSSFGAGGGLNNFGFFPPSPSIFAVPGPSSTELSPYSPLLSDLLRSPSGLTSPVADQRITSLIPQLVLAFSGHNFNASLFSSCLSSLVAQISQSTSLSTLQITIEAVLEMISALLSILPSAQLGAVSTLQDGTLSVIRQSIFSSLNA